MINLTYYKLYTLLCTFKNKKAMDRETYTMMVGLRSQIPPKKETPKGQKFHIGEIVKIVDTQNHPNRLGLEGNTAEIQYTYSQKFGGDDIKNYSLKHLWEDSSSSWWGESQLELFKGINEINEEKDLAEYKRLKAKYDGV